MNDTLGIVELTAMLQSSITPVVLISGIGLLLVSMTQRLSRVIDRIRQLSAEATRAGDPQRELLDRQVTTLYRRARVNRLAIIFAANAVMFAALIILTLFLIQLTHTPLVLTVIVEFTVCLLSLLVALSLYIKDVGDSLESLDVHLSRKPE